MPKNYLAIDYGERRVGLAFACGSIGIAFPRETIDLSEKNLWTELEKQVKTNKITDFVLGMPIHPNNHPDSKQKTVENFAKELQKKFPEIELHTQDESYSTQDAMAIVGTSKNKIDKTAAAIILQRFLAGNF
ncbi:MAG: Holliday junction resolvase RuvX [Fibromonadaceae bacterium]|jgi:putative Holliday junction resolvase|nr:Holliday junction resolvase RuvX [Fibromonadaceae bacterium]